MKLKKYNEGGNKNNYIKSNKNITSQEHITLSGPGCWLGDDVYVEYGCTAYIVCNGSPNVECTEFDASSPQYNVRLLKVVDDYCGGAVGGGTAYLEYYDGITWIIIDSFPTNVYNGWAWVGWTLYPSGAEVRYRIRWAGCTKEWMQIKKPPEFSSIIISPSYTEINIGNIFVPVRTCYDQYGNWISCPTLTWSSTNPSVATVDSNGVVTGISIGTTDITASALGITSNISTVSVLEQSKLTLIELSPSQVSINIGKTKQLTITCKDQYNKLMSCPTLTWSSTNPSVATVDSNGVVTGISIGTTDITASASGITSNISTVSVSACSSLSINANILFKWTNTPKKLSDPDILPPYDSFGISWSPNGEFLAVAHYNYPYITIYQRSGTTFTKLPGPNILPTSNTTNVSWSRNSEFLAVSHFLFPHITIYQRSGTTFTKLRDPAVLPRDVIHSSSWSVNDEFLAVSLNDYPYIIIYKRYGTTFSNLPSPDMLPIGISYDISWSPNGEFLAISFKYTPHIIIYQRFGTTFTKLPDPDILPANTGFGLSWSVNDEFLAVAHINYPYITIYQRSGTTFTKLPDPNILPPYDSNSISWSPSIEFLAVAHYNYPYITIYQRSGTTFTKLPDPDILPPYDSFGISWSPNGEFLAVAHINYPYVTIYQTDKIIIF